MLTDQVIRETARRIADAASAPARVVLFGSYGRGDADDSSDLDLLVIEPEIADPSAEYLRLRQAVGPIGIGVDLLLYSQLQSARVRTAPPVVDHPRLLGRPRRQGAP